MDAGAVEGVGHSALQLCPAVVIRSLATQVVLMTQLVVGAVQKAASKSPSHEEQTEPGGEPSLPTIQQPPPEEKVEQKGRAESEARLHFLLLKLLLLATTCAL